VSKALILTALPVEFNAVREHLTNVQEIEHPQGTIYEQGVFGEEDRTWQVSLLQVGMGNERAALEAERAIGFLSPELVLFVGVAGGLKDVRLGDVVAATKVYGYEFGKANKEFHPRPELGESSYALTQRAQAVARNTAWQQRIVSGIPDPMPLAISAPMAAGSKVIASEASDEYEFIRSAYSDACAVEMEGYGFLRAIHANAQVEALVLRGISDLIEGKQGSDSEGWQFQASRNVAAFAFEILATYRTASDRQAITNQAVASISNSGDHRIAEASSSTQLEASASSSLPPLAHSFTGRVKEIDRIRTHLGGLDILIPSIAVIYGLSGVGKTQLSRQYVDIFNEQYDAVYWIPASYSLLATSAYAQLAADLALPGYIPDNPLRSSESALRWIEKQHNWLIILDDADPTEMSRLIPRRGAGHILVTSINPNWSAIAGAKIALEGLLPEEAVSFLTRRTGSLDMSKMLEVGESFDFLPLALEQAASYVESTGIDFEAYGQLLASHRATLLDERSPFTDYPKSVYSAIRMNVSHVVDRSQESMAVLAFVAFLGNSSIPRQLVRDAIESYLAQQGQAFDDYLFNGIIAECAKFSLIRTENAKVSVHPLIQAFILDSSTIEAREGWNHYTLSCLSHAFPSDVEDSSTWPHCEELIDHVVSAAGHAQFQSWTDEFIEALYSNAGAYLHEMGRDDQAYEMLSAVYREAETAYGEDDPRVALAMNNLLNTLGDLDRGEEAASLGRLAIQRLTKDKSTQEQYEIEIGKLYSNLGRIYLHKRRNPMAARWCFMMAYAIHSSVLGENHYTTGIDINNLGTVARSEHRWKEAHYHFFRAVSIHRSQLKTNDYRLATAIFNLATATYNLGFYATTEYLLREAIEMNDSFSRRSTSSDQLDAMSALARILRDSNRHGESIEIFDRAIDISTILYGPDSLRTRKLRAERDEALALKRSPTATYI